MDDLLPVPVEHGPDFETHVFSSDDGSSGEEEADEKMVQTMGSKHSGDEKTPSRGCSPARSQSRDRSRSRSPPVSRKKQALEVTKQKRKANVMSSKWMTGDDKVLECQYIDDMEVRKGLCKICGCCHTEGPVCNHSKQEQDDHVDLLKQWKEEEKEKRLEVQKEKARQVEQKRQEREAKKKQKKLEAKAQRELNKQMKNEKAEADAHKVQVFDELFESVEQALKAKKLLDACNGLSVEEVQEMRKASNPVTEYDDRIEVP